MRYVDLSHTFVDHMPVFPGEPEARILPIATIERDEYANSQIVSSVHVGTHVEGPAHVFPDHPFLADIDPRTFFGRGRLVDARGRRTLDPDLLGGHTIEPTDIILLLTGMSAWYGEDRYVRDYPAMTKAFAEAVAHRKPRVLGLDFLSPEPSPIATLENHRILLGAGMFLIENLTNLSSLVGIPSFGVIALPMKIRADAAFARVLAVVP